MNWGKKLFRELATTYTREVDVHDVPRRPSMFIEVLRRSTLSARVVSALAMVALVRLPSGVLAVAANVLANVHRLWPNIGMCAFRLARPGRRGRKVKQRDLDVVDGLLLLVRTLGRGDPTM